MKDAKIETFLAGDEWLWQFRCLDKTDDATVSVAANSAKGYSRRDDAIAAALKVAEKLGLTVDVPS